MAVAPPPLQPRLRSESDTHAELHRTRLSHSCHLTERRRRVARIGARTEIAVEGDDVGAVGEVESLDQPFEPQARPDGERPADPRVQAEEVGALAGIAIDERAVDDR